MDTNLQIIISLLYIIVPQILLGIYLVILKRPILGDEVGPKVGENFWLNKFIEVSLKKSLNIEQLEDSNIVICFASMTCSECTKMLEYINKNMLSNLNEIYVIVAGAKEEVESWYSRNNYEFNFGIIDNDILFNELKINKLPFVMSLSKSIVVKKGFFIKEKFKEFFSIMEQEDIEVYSRRQENV